MALLLSSRRLQAMDSKGAIACSNALPEKYRAGVLKLSADDANANPDTWDVSAQAGRDDKGMRSIEGACSQIVANKSTLGSRETFSSSKPLNLSKIQVDLRRISDTAQNHTRANAKQIGTVSFVMNQQVGPAVPLWSVWCYGLDGTYYSEMKFLATDGTITSSGAFSQKP